MHRMFSVFLFFFLAAAWVGPPSATAGDASSITAKDLINRISQARGKFVVINFWASWCRPCRQEIPELITLRRDYSEDDLLLLGVSVDQDPGQFSRFVSQMSFNYPVYLGGGDVAGLFAVGSIPKMVIFDRKGEMIYNREGYLPSEALRELLSRPPSGKGA